MFALAGRIALSLALALALGIALPHLAAAQALKGAEAQTEAQAAAAHLGRVQTLTAAFDMVTPGGINPGKIFVDRGRQAIRLEFGPPLNHLMLANGPVIQFFGGDGTQVETATAGTPMAFLMDPEKALRDSIEVLSVDKNDNGMLVAVAERGKREDGQVLLHFQGDGAWRLAEWSMFTKNGNFTQTKLRDVKTGQDLDADLFRAPQ